MPFPSVVPTSRQFEPGDWPIRTFASQSGTETRILYGTRRTGAKMSLSYENITDTQAALFLSDYDAQIGTFRTFALPAEVRAGWSGAASSIDAPINARWRYEGPPQIRAVRPGRSSVIVSLKAVL